MELLWHLPFMHPSSLIFLKPSWPAKEMIHWPFLHQISCSIASSSTAVVTLCAAVLAPEEYLVIWLVWMLFVLLRLHTLLLQGDPHSSGPLLSLWIVFVPGISISGLFTMISAVSLVLTLLPCEIILEIKIKLTIAKNWQSNAISEWLHGILEKIHHTIGLEGKGELLSLDIDQFIMNAAIPVFFTHHTVLDFSSSSSVFGWDMLFNLLYLAGCHKWGHRKCKLINNTDEKDHAKFIDFDYVIGD